MDSLGGFASQSQHCRLPHSNNNWPLREGRRGGEVAATIATALLLSLLLLLLLLLHCYGYCDHHHHNRHPEPRDCLAHRCSAQPNTTPHCTSCGVVPGFVLWFRASDLLVALEAFAPWFQNQGLLSETVNVEVRVSKQARLSMVPPSTASPAFFASAASFCGISRTKLRCQGAKAVLSTSAGGMFQL